MIRTMPPALLRARDMIEPALRESIRDLAPDIQRVVGYHLGFSDAEGQPVAGEGGKAVRPALALLSAEAAGAPADVGIPGAVAVELVHNFSLLHDDVMDHDLERRHRPTAWALFGMGQAIVTGDALMVLAQRVLMEPATPEHSSAAAALARATAGMIEGQAQDLSFQSRLDVSVDECERMSANKTGALLSCASSIGAILAGAGDLEVASLAEFGLHLGLAFQAIDDWLGIWGRPALTGKPVAGDIREQKKTLPVVIALAAGGPDSDRLRELLSNGGLSEAQVSMAADLVERCGGSERTRTEAGRHLALALGALDRAPLALPAREQLEEIARFVTARDF
ncbi:MAG: polyprenyl synthetase family protein [Actinobacteria bacterium]|nr:MAG: polyprenyl synthetase family protein [Actinomycetota bacterium]